MSAQMCFSAPQSMTIKCLYFICWFFLCLLNSFGLRMSKEDMLVEFHTGLRVLRYSKWIHEMRFDALIAPLTLG